MKKKFFYSALFLLGLSCTGLMTTSCSDDDEPQTTGGGEIDFDEAANLDYTASNSQSWRNYARQVALLLERDAATLYDSWETSYDGGVAFKETFKNHNGGAYTNVMDCITEIIDKCVEITDEVGNEKIGDPYRKYSNGQYTEALYAVESWYSFHSRDDYSNNIRSIRNSYFGSTDSTISTNSLYRIMERIDPTLNTQVVEAIEYAKNAILAIPQPFRNNIGAAEVPVAQSACISLGNILDTQLRNAIQTAANNGTVTSAELDEVVNTYTDQVVLPTYKSLKEKNTLLREAVDDFYNSPSNATFEAACEAWLVAREPWEQSEAFLFGPVDALGLDPNMDSWPLDQVAIVRILESGNFDDLDWSDGDSDATVEAAQNVRGFHTLEFLLFKNGNPRTVQ
ncbi:MAG: imelysin family protein [Bacteroidaceae bacterium]|jgi:predicted lipoprotein